MPRPHIIKEAIYMYGWSLTKEEVEKILIEEEIETKYGWIFKEEKNGILYIVVYSDWDYDIKRLHYQIDIENKELIYAKEFYLFKQKNIWGDKITYFKLYWTEYNNMRWFLENAFDSNTYEFYRLKNQKELRLKEKDGTLKFMEKEFI